MSGFELRPFGRWAMASVAAIAMAVPLVAGWWRHDEIFFYSLGDARLATLVRLFLWSGQDPNGVFEGHTPLTHMAFKSPAYGAEINLLRVLEAGADPNLADAHGRLPLVELAGWGAWDRVARLLAHGAEPNLVERGGRSVAAELFTLTSPERVEANLKLLLEHGLDPCFVLDGRVVGQSSAAALSLADWLASRERADLGGEVAALCAHGRGGS